MTKVFKEICPHVVCFEFVQEDKFVRMLFAFEFVQEDANMIYCTRTILELLRGHIYKGYLRNFSKKCVRMFIVV